MIPQRSCAPSRRIPRSSAAVTAAVRSSTPSLAKGSQGADAYVVYHAAFSRDLNVRGFLSDGAATASAPTGRAPHGQGDTNRDARGRHRGREDRDHSVGAGSRPRSSTSTPAPRSGTRTSTRPRVATVLDLDSPRFQPLVDAFQNEVRGFFRPGEVTLLPPVAGDGAVAGVGEVLNQALRDSSVSVVVTEGRSPVHCLLFAVPVFG